MTTTTITTAAAAVPAPPAVRLGLWEQDPMSADPSARVARVEVDGAPSRYTLRNNGGPGWYVWLCLDGMTVGSLSWREGNDPEAVAAKIAAVAAKDGAR